MKYDQAYFRSYEIMDKLLTSRQKQPKLRGYGVTIVTFLIELHNTCLSVQEVFGANYENVMVRKN